MANEISVNVGVQLSNGALNDAASIQFREDQVAAQLAGGTQTIGTSHEAIALGDVSTPGPSLLVNLDSTNFVEIGIDDSSVFVPMVKIAPGQAALIQPADSVTLYAQADTAPVVIRRLIPSL